MRNSIWTKRFAVGIILLFIGAGIASGVTANNKNATMTLTKTLWIVDNEGDGDFLTIQSAIENVSDGDTIDVYSGNYTENITINKKLTLNGYPVEYLSGNDTGNPIITILNKNETHTVVIKSDDVCFSGFNVTGSGHDWVVVGDYKGYRYGGILITAHSSNIFNCSIYKNGFGIGVYGEGDDINISNCRICYNWDDGIRLNIGHVEIFNNVINFNGRDEPEGEPLNNGDGIELHELPLGARIINNIILGNQVDGIWIETCDSHWIIGNSISKNKNYGIHLSESRNNHICSNNITENIGGISLVDSDENIIENNTISFNDAAGISLLQSNSNKINHNRINENKYGIRFKFTTQNEIQLNDIKENQWSLWFFLSIMDSITQNNIVTHAKIKLTAFFSFSLAIFNWWGDERGPLLNMNRIIFGIIIVLPWSLREFDIIDGSLREDG